MAERSKTYFVSDVHLGLDVNDPAGREERFVAFLKKINSPETKSLYMLGDIWDFWYEWRGVVPMGYARVFAALQDLKEAGIELYFINGNHDVWTYRYFSEMGIKILQQPYFFELGSQSFCIGHGDGLGGSKFSYKLLRLIFHSKFMQFCFSSFIHPSISMAFGKAWSKHNRKRHKFPYKWKGQDENLYKFCLDVLKERKVDQFIFGHFHVRVEETLPGGARLRMLDSWISGDDCYVVENLD